MIEITVPAIPIAQPRQRHAMIAGHLRNYTPTEHPVQAFKASVRLAADQACDGPPLNEPIRLDVMFVLPRPQNRIWKRKPMPAEPHAKKPDLDNLLKAVKDALSGLVWRDDSLICECVARKLVASGDEQPHCYIMVDVANAPTREDHRRAHR